MKSFKNSLTEDFLTEGRSPATDMEAYITVAWNGFDPDRPDDDNLQILVGAGLGDIKGKYFKKLWPAAKSIANELRGSLPGAKGIDMKHMGKVAATLSSDWANWGGTNTTSKTDTMIGKKYRLSLKSEDSEGASQLLSAHTNEAIATFKAALANMEELGDNEVKIVKKIISNMEKLTTVSVEKGFTIGDLTGPVQSEIKKRKAEIKDRTKKALSVAKKAAKKAKRELSDTDILNIETSIAASLEYNPQISPMIYDVSAGKMVPNKAHPLSHSVQGKTYRKKKEDIVFTWGGTKDSSETNDESELINKYMRDKEIEYFNQSKFQDQAETLFNEFFETNLKFKTHFTWEAATGRQKFKGDLDPQANWMFKFSIPGKKIVNIEPLGDSGPSPYTKKMAKKMSYRMSWKTHSSKDAGTHPALRGETKPGKVARLRDLLNLAPHDFGALNNQFVSPMSKMINEEFNVFMEAESENMGKLLNEWNTWYDQEMLNEGLLSWAKGAKDKIAGKLKQTIGKVYNKILNFLKALVKKVFDTMRALADKGVSSVLDYIGIEPKTVQVSLPF